MLNANAMIKAVINAGMASFKSDHGILLKELIIMIPTKINDGAMAALGIMANRGDAKELSKHEIATTTLVKPVRPPAPIPAELST